ncbi:hypothetical protein GOP47_0013161, partial [Adiantum capillus-veneris]
MEEVLKIVMNTKALTIAAVAPLAKLDVEAEKELSIEVEIQGQRAEIEGRAE